MSGGSPAMSALDDDDESVLCRVCYRPFAQITASHLSMHGMSLDEYREKHPDAPLRSGAVEERIGWSEDSHGDSTRDKIAKAIRRKHESGDYD